MNPAWFRMTPITGATLLLAACGGVLQLAGIEGTGDSNGSATGYGSLFVNGDGFDTSAAEITLDGVAVAETAIQIGMQTSVDGNIGEARARRISASRSLRGPVDAINRVGETQSATLTVLGQPVSVDEMTRFSGTTLDAIDTNTLLDVHALARPGGAWLATFIGLAGSDYVAGSVELDITAQVESTGESTLTLAGLTVDTANATTGETVDGGDRVRVVGLQPERGGELVAQRIELLGGPLDAGREIVREGLIASVDGERITVAGLPVDVSSAERVDATDTVLAQGTRAIVRGISNDDGVVEATTVRAIPTARTVLETVITRGGSDAPVLANLSLRTLDITQYVESRPGEPLRFRATDLADGESVRVTGYRDRNARFVATRIERVAPRDDDALRGIVTSSQSGVDTGTLTIDGFTVRTGGSTTFVSTSGSTVSSTAFYAGLSSGARVQAQGTLDPATGALDADRVRQLSTAEAESGSDDPTNRAGGIGQTTP